MKTSKDSLRKFLKKKYAKPEKDCLGRVQTVCYVLNNRIYVPTYFGQKANVRYTYPGAGGHTYSNFELRQMGAQKNVEMLWNRGYLNDD